MIINQVIQLTGYLIVALCLVAVAIVVYRFIRRALGNVRKPLIIWDDLGAWLKTVHKETEQPAEAEEFCRYCGAKLRATDVKCENCGAGIKQ